MGINLSMSAVKEFLKREDVLRISKNKQRDLWQLNSSVKNLVRDNLKDIWSSNGMICEARDKDTGNVKNIKVIYHSFANECLFDSFDYVEYAFNFEENRLDKGANSFIGNIIEILEQTILGQKDIGPFAPKGYDLDYDREHLAEGEELSSYESYWDYDVEFIIGDFILYKDSKKNYAYEAAMIATHNNIPVNFNEDTVVNRYVAMLPIKINYIKVQRENSVIDVNYKEE